MSPHAASESEQLFNKGTENFYAEEYLEAFLCFESLLEIQPENAAVWLWQGKTLREISYGHVKDRRDRLPEKYASTWIAQVNNSNQWWGNRESQALACFNRATELEPSSTEAWREKGKYWVQLVQYANQEKDREKRVNAYQEALNNFDHAICCNPNDEENWLERGRTFENLIRVYYYDRNVQLANYYDEALTSYERAIALNPNFYQGWQAKASLLTWEYYSQHEEALNCYDRVLELAVELPEVQRSAWYGKATTLEALGRDEEALVYYEKRLATSCPGHIRYRAEAVKERLKLRQLEQAVTNNPNSWEAWHQKAQELVKQEKYREAINCCDRSLALAPVEVAQIWIERGRAFFNLGEYEEAIADFEKALNYDPKDQFVWNSLGEAYFNLQRYETAITCFDRALACPDNPNHSTEHNNFLNLASWSDRAEALRLSEQYAEAVENYDHAIAIAKALNLDEFDINENLKLFLWYRKGLALVNLGRFIEAIACHFYPDSDNATAKAEQIWTEMSDKVILWASLGERLVCDGFENYQEAVIYLSKGLEIDPNHFPSLKYHASALLRLKRYEECITDYQHLLKIQPDFSDGWFNLGWALYHLKSYEESVASYSQAIALVDNDPSAWTNRAQSLLELHRYEEALADCEKALAIKPNYHFAIILRQKFT